MLTADGLRDSIQHGRDFWSVYGPWGKNALLHGGINERDVYFRTSNSDRTYQVSGGLIAGMDGWKVKGNFPVHTMPSNMDDIVPNYSCNYANGFRDQEQSLPAWNDHLNSKAGLFKALNDVVGTADQSGWNSWIDHHFDAMASRQCHGHDLPKNPATGASISQDLANQAYNEGHWEYDYIWNSGSGADNYVKYGFGVFMQELSTNLQRFKSGEDKYKLKYYVGHDGTMVRLYKSLGLAGQFKWPAMGSEVVIEVYKQKNEQYVRVLKDGKPMQSVVKEIADDQGLISWVCSLSPPYPLISGIRDSHTNQDTRLTVAFGSLFGISPATHRLPSTRSSTTSTLAFHPTSTPSVFSESKAGISQAMQAVLRSARSSKLPHQNHPLGFVCRLYALHARTAQHLMRHHPQKHFCCSSFFPLPLHRLLPFHALLSHCNPPSHQPIAGKVVLWRHNSLENVSCYSQAA